jgi:hypothetical protein
MHPTTATQTPARGIRTGEGTKAIPWLWIGVAKLTTTGVVVNRVTSVNSMTWGWTTAPIVDRNWTPIHIIPAFLRRRPSLTMLSGAAGRRVDGLAAR